MRGKRILLADDSWVAQAAVAQAATIYGCEVIPVLEGLEVTSTAVKEHPDLIVLDLTFPDADGRWILAQLKGDPRTSATPVVIWSSYDPGPNRQFFLARGAEDYVEKSDPLTLLAKVKRILFRREGPGPARAEPLGPLARRASNDDELGG